MDQAREKINQEMIAEGKDPNDLINNPATFGESIARTIIEYEKNNNWVGLEEWISFNPSMKNHDSDKY